MIVSEPMADGDVPPSFSCPRCGKPVPAGATRCLACAERGRTEPAHDATLAAAAPVQPPGSMKTLVTLGCLALVLVVVVLTGSAALLGQKVRETAVREQKREMQRVIDEERRHYEAEQAHKGGRPQRLGVEPAGELAALGRPLADLQGQEVAPSTALERGGVVVIYPQGCEDCTKKLAGAEAVLQLAKHQNLGAHLVVAHGTAAGIAQDKVPESIRAFTLLDADGKVAEALGVRHMTAIVIDSDGSSIVYRGSCEEAKGMVPSVAQGE